ncbi:hypothetical protein JCM11641_002810 [Rhodosporidiobolus odoratus]
MNNPFAKQPQTELQNTAQRFPDVLSQDPDLQQPPYPQHQHPYHQQLQSQYSGYQPQQQIQSVPFQTLYTPSQQSSYLSPQQTGYAPSSYSAHSPSSYGTQLQPTQHTSFPDLDPYASLGTLTSQSGPSSGGGEQPGQGALLHVQQTQSHPRRYVQEAKAQLTSWDTYAWRQLLNRVDALREAWETRKSGLQAAANQGGEPTSVEQLRQKADSYVDSIHAAKMQLAEVQQGWRHSTDPASKARVREALNAGLSSLPEYPPPVLPQELGGAFYRRAEDSYRKSTIMSQYSASQQQPQYQIQPQATGFGGFHGGVSNQPTGYGGYPQQQQQQTELGGLQPQMTGYIPQQQTGYYSGGAYAGQPQFY